MTTTEDRDQDGTDVEQQPNDDWSARTENWGEGFIVKVEAEGRERVGEKAALVADKAVVNQLHADPGLHPPGDGKPAKFSLEAESVVFKTDHAALTVTFYTDRHSDETIGALFDQVERTLDDPSTLKEITTTIEEDWNRVAEVA